MAAYSDTTNEVLTLAFERLRGSIPDDLIGQLKGLAANDRLDAASVKALLDATAGRGEGR